MRLQDPLCQSTLLCNLARCEKRLCFGCANELRSNLVGDGRTIRTAQQSACGHIVLSSFSQSFARGPLLSSDSHCPFLPFFECSLRTPEQTTRIPVKVSLGSPGSIVPTLSCRNLPHSGRLYRLLCSISSLRLFFASKNFFDISSSTSCSHCSFSSFTLLLLSDTRQQSSCCLCFPDQQINTPASKQTPSISSTAYGRRTQPAPHAWEATCLLNPPYHTYITPLLILESGGRVVRLAVSIALSFVH